MGNGRAIRALSMIAVGLFQRAPNARSARSSDRKIEDSAYIVPDAVKYDEEDSEQLVEWRIG